MGSFVIFKFYLKLKIGMNILGWRERWRSSETKAREL